MKIDIGPSGFSNDLPKHKIDIGEISPLWQLPIFWQFFESLFIVWHLF